MKMFKKLMAVALAGVMALTLLAGCANKIVPVSEKEILACITDSNPLSYRGKDGDVKITLKGAEETDAVKALKVLQDYKEANKDTEILNQHGYIDSDVFMANSSAFAEALGVTAETKEKVTIGCVKIEDYQSQYMKEMHNNQLANQLLVYARAVNYGYAKAGEGTISLKIGKIGDENYVVAVARLPMEE